MCTTGVAFHTTLIRRACCTPEVSLPFMFGLTTAGLVTTLHAEPVFLLLDERACAGTRPCTQHDLYFVQVILRGCTYSSGTVPH
jgi:hypothetical protein